MWAIGASAVNRAVKAIAVARSYLMPEGIDIVCIFSFSEVVIDGQKRAENKRLMEAVVSQVIAAQEETWITGKLART